MRPLQRSKRTALALAAMLFMAGLAPAAGPGVPKQALAFYYGWYGNPDISGHWLHWKNVDVAKKHIDESTHYPVLEAYDSHDPKILDIHCSQAKKAGLTGFIVSWWRPGDFHDAGMPLMLDAARKHGLKVTVYYEIVPPRGAPTVEGAGEDLAYIVKKYAQHPAWLKAGGKPVIFVYARAVNNLKLPGWRKVIEEFNAKYPPGATFIGDNISAESAQVFDGVHTYNPTALSKRKSPEEIQTWARKTFPEWVKTAGPSHISCVTIIPGYDDSCQPSRKPPRPITERHNGKTYEIMWQEAIAAKPDWVIITSWNEWHEGSEIEPSVEDGDLALKTTEMYAKKFLAPKSR